MSKYFSTEPWAEPYWYYGRSSPYYKLRHHKFRDSLRAWIEENLVVDNFDPANTNDAFRLCAKVGLTVPVAAGSRIPPSLGTFPVFAGIKVEEWDGFFDLILWTELFRRLQYLPCGVSGLLVGAPPVLTYGSQQLKDDLLPKLLRGEKRICFAATEPDVGSDLKNVKTTAEKSRDGTHYIVNGEKKWITGGLQADYFTCLVRTGGSGASGLSVLVVPRSEGVATRPIALGLDGQEETAFVSFDDVRVPSSYLVGEEGQGFRYVLDNLNHERLIVAFQALALSRNCVGQAMAWARKREAFGKTLIEQPVVRNKFANMGRQIESLQSWTEQLVFESGQLGHTEGKSELGGTTALLKAQSGISLKYVADECQKIFGGLGMTRTGPGSEVEAITRRVSILVIPGGAEDVMLDLGTREAVKASKRYAEARKSRL